MPPTILPTSTQTAIPTIAPNIIITPGVCPLCHKPTLPEYYFCPNCGTLLRTPPLSISIFSQIKLYAFSIILPMMGFIFVTRWQGNKYFRSEDEKTQQIGLIAWGLIILSTIVVIWVAIAWAKSYTQETVNDLNSEMSGYSSQ